MSPLFLLSVGLMLIVNVKPAPTPVSNNRISERILFIKANPRNLVHMPKRPSSLSISNIDRLDTPSLDNRFNLDDKRQNWGLLMNGSNNDQEDDTNYNRPITIPRVPTSYQHSPEKNIQIKTKAVPELCELKSLEPKGFLEKKSEETDVSKLTNNELKKMSVQCDLARVKCCISEHDAENCFKANECFKLEKRSDLCDAKSLQECIERVLTDIHLIRDN